MSFSFGTKKTLSSVYIVAAKRTPIGSFMGKLSNFTATELGGFAVKAAIDSIKLNPKEIDEVILGNIFSAGLGQAPARQASIKGGIGINVPCTTINKMCSSGMKSIVFGSQSIQLGHSTAVMTGGFECMSNAPFFVNVRNGFGYGDQKMIDSISNDGLKDAQNRISMGLCAQKTVTDFKITREAQDKYCKLSYKRHAEASKAGYLKEQIVPVIIKDKKSEEEFCEDEQPTNYKQQKVSNLFPSFSKVGTITAANSSKINDGASAIVIMSEEKMNRLGLKPLAKIINYADHEMASVDFSIAPHYAAKKVLAKCQMNIGQIDYFQFNQAFSSVALVNQQLLDIPISKVNLHGGAVSIGHPIGASGARIIQSLMTVLKHRKGRYGLAGVCNGGGGATAMIIQNLQ